MSCSLFRNDLPELKPSATGGSTSSVLHLSCPSMYRWYCSVLSPETSSIVKDPNLDEPEGI